MRQQQRLDLRSETKDYVPRVILCSVSNSQAAETFSDDHGQFTEVL